MKRTAIGHSKVRALADAMRKPHYAAVGILESLWHLTAREAPAGNIGKLTNKAIAMALDWRGKPDVLINALIETGWIDECDHYRLLIHDWADHADDAVHMALARSGKLFAGGEMPSLAKINVKDRPEIEERLDAAREKWEQTIGSRSDSVRTNAHKSALPSPALPCPARPSHAMPVIPAARAAGSELSADGEANDDDNDGDPETPEEAAHSEAWFKFQQKHVYPKAAIVLEQLETLRKQGRDEDPHDPLVKALYDELARIAVRAFGEHREEHQRIQEDGWRLQDERWQRRKARREAAIA
jgi:hypothetical protein